MITNDGDLSIARLAPLIRRKTISPVEITIALLERILRLQPYINAYITICYELALDQAKKAEKEIVRGKYRGFLHGIPISLKDMFYTRGIPTTAGSKILKNFVPENDAPVVNRLLRAGCILLGKTNMHEFAFGATNINPHFGAVRNPWNPRCISGGSSGGSAASVVSAQSIASLGTDTGGSIRIPAAACGCVGLKPTYGLVSLQGVIPLSPSLDHVGPLCRSVSDAALLFEALRHSDAPLPSLELILRSLHKQVRYLKIGVPRHYFFDHLQSEVKQAFEAAAKVFNELGAEIHEIEMQGMEETARIASDITAAEAAASHEEWLKYRPGKYGKDVRSRLQQGRRLTATAYIKTMQEKAAYTAKMERALNSVNLLLVPTLPFVAPCIHSDKSDDRKLENMRNALLSLTRPANISGLPALSVPCGFSSDRLPIGLQFIGRRFEEATILKTAYAYEQATFWHREFPADSCINDRKQRP